MNAMLSICFVLLAALVAMPAYALEPLAPYDDFQAKVINPDKWREAGSGRTSRDFARQIHGGQLRLLNRSYANTNSDSSFRFSAALLEFANSAAVTGIEATIRVAQVDVVGCPSNFRTGAGARLQGNFFNTGTPTPGSAVGDVNVSIHIERSPHSTEPAGVLTVFGLVHFCADLTCTTGVTDRHELGTVLVGQATRVRMQWDKENHRFIFQRDGGPEVFAPYSVSDTSPPGNQFKHLSGVTFVANCTAKPRPLAFTEAFFEDVFVNESAAP